MSDDSDDEPDVSKGPFFTRGWDHLAMFLAFAAGLWRFDGSFFAACCDTLRPIDPIMKAARELGSQEEYLEFLDTCRLLALFQVANMLFLLTFFVIWLFGWCKRVLWNLVTKNGGEWPSGVGGRIWRFLCGQVFGQFLLVIVSACALFGGPFADTFAGEFVDELSTELVVGCAGCLLIGNLLFPGIWWVRRCLPFAWMRWIYSIGIGALGGWLLSPPFVQNLLRALPYRI